MKKGFTLMELLVSIVIMTMLLLVVLPTISKIINKNNNELFTSYEDMVAEYAALSAYKNNDRIELNNIEGLDTVKKECTGYVITTKTTTPYTYKAYIKCGNKYKTSGYTE